MNQNIRNYLIVCLYLSMLTSPLLAGDWITGGGNPERHAQSNEYGPSSSDILWETSSPAWFGNQIFTEGDRLVTRRYLAPYNVPIICYSMDTGELLWELNLPGAFQSLPLGCRDGKVYALNYHESGDDTLYALDIEDGSVIWQVLVPELFYFYSPESASFAPNGDLILGDLFNVCRYDHANGNLLWTFNRVGFASGCSEAIVHETTAYVWSQTGGVFQIVAVDIDTGTERYRIGIPGVAGGPAQQAAPGCVAPNGRIYIHRQGDNITALEDTGVNLQLLWSTTITGSAPFGYIAASADNYVYAPIDGAVIQIDGSTGVILNTSQIICSTVNTKSRFAISMDGTVYASDGEDELYAFSADLQTLWTISAPNINDSGPALGMNGCLVVASNGFIKAFQTSSLVSISLTPYNPPIQIPAIGGSFDFNIEVTNDDTNPQTFDTWIAVQLPEGSWIEPLMGPVNLTLSGGLSINRDRTQNVPDYALGGTYTYEGRVGTYPGEIWAADNFSFDKLGESEDGWIENWLNDGESLFDGSDQIAGMPSSELIMDSYPNPFNPTTVISYQLSAASFVNLAVYDVSGREVAELVNGWRDAGVHEVTFDGSNLVSGVYVYQLTTGIQSSVGKMMLVK
jgi:outer membrane protein assembly factor BamB